MLLLAVALCSHAAFATQRPHHDGSTTSSTSSSTSGSTSGSTSNATSTSASATPTDAEARLADAQAAFDSLQTEDAEKKLEALVADSSAPEAVRAKAWLTLGLARASLLDDDGARVAFAAALAIDGSLAPPADSSPKVKALFARIKSRLPAGGIPVDPTKPVAQADTPPTTVTPTATSTTPTTTTTSTTTTAPPTTATDQTGFVASTVVGAVALAAAAALGGVAWASDSALATPEAGRTRDQYQTIRSVGIAGVVGAGICAIGGAVALAIGIGGMS